MTYVAVVISCLMVVGIVALVIQTIQSAGSEPWLKISAAIIQFPVRFPFAHSAQLRGGANHGSGLNLPRPGINFPGPASRRRPTNQRTGGDHRYPCQKVSVRRVDSHMAAKNVDSTGVKYDAVASKVRLPFRIPRFQSA